MSARASCLLPGSCRSWLAHPLGAQNGNCSPSSGRQRGACLPRPATGGQRLKQQLPAGPFWSQPVWARAALHAPQAGPGRWKDRWEAGCAGRSASGCPESEQVWTGLPASFFPTAPSPPVGAVSSLKFFFFFFPLYLDLLHSCDCAGRSPCWFLEPLIPLGGGWCGHSHLASEPLWMP